MGVIGFNPTPSVQSNSIATTSRAVLFCQWIESFKPTINGTKIIILLFNIKTIDFR